ncbi:hypothetical protein BDC45DRAFT_601700 [Circinella umbellata]|nr:hypothetical protein BDC45DRAFT_601700 [Circinella umbellata]
MRSKEDEHDNKTTVSFSYKPNPSRRFTPSASPSSSSTTPINYVVGSSTVESLSNNNNPEKPLYTQRPGAAVSGSKPSSWRTNNNGNKSSNLSIAKINKSNDTIIISDDDNSKNDNNNNNDMVADPASFISSLFKKTNNSNRSSTTSTVKIKKEYSGIVNPMTSVLPIHHSVQSVLETKQPYQQQQRIMKSDPSRINAKRQPLPLIPSYNEQQQLHRKKEEPLFTVPIKKHYQLSEPSSSTASNHHHSESLSSPPQAPKTPHATPTPTSTFTHMYKPSIDSDSSDDESQKQKHIQLPLDSYRHQQGTPPSSRSTTSFPLTSSYFLPPTSLENLNKSVEEQPLSHSSISAPCTETQHDRNNNREQQQGQLIPTSPPENLSITSSFSSIIPLPSTKKESQNVNLKTSSNNDRTSDNCRNYEEMNSNNDGVAANDNNKHNLPEKGPYLIHNNRPSSVFQTRSSMGVFADDDDEEEENNQVLLSQQNPQSAVMERNVRDTTFTNKLFYNNKPPMTISSNSSKSRTASVHQQQSRSAPSSQHPSFILQPHQKQQINTTSITQVDEIEQLARICKEKLVEQVQKYNYVTNEIKVLQTTIDSQQQCINQKERQATELTNWVEIMLSRQHQFDTSVTSLRGRYEAFSSVMSDLKKFANTCNETRNDNTKTFEDFERRYCNQLLEQLSHLKGNYTELDTIVLKLRSEHEELKSSILSLIEEYETERAKDHGELQDVENQEKYVNEIQSLQNNVQEMTLELSSHTTQSKQLKENINTTHEICIGLKSELSKIQANIMEMGKMLDETELQKKAFDSERERIATNDLEEKVLKINERHAKETSTYSQTIDKMRTEIKDLQQERITSNQRYEMELEKLRQEKSDLVDHNSALAEELKQEKERHQSLENRLNSGSSPTSIVTTNYATNSQGSLRQHQETTTPTAPNRPLASSSKDYKQHQNGVKKPVEETTSARVDPSNTERSVSVSNARGGNSKMTLRSINNQSYKIKAEEDLPQEEPLRKRRKRNLINRKKLPVDKLISVDSDDDDVEKEMQALIAASDPYKTTNAKGKQPLPSK